MTNYFICHLYKLMNEVKEYWIQPGIKQGSLLCQASALPLDHCLNLPSAHQSMLLSQLFIMSPVIHDSLAGTMYKHATQFSVELFFWLCIHNDKLFHLSPLQINKYVNY